MYQVYTAHRLQSTHDDKAQEMREKTSIIKIQCVIMQCSVVMSGLSMIPKTDTRQFKTIRSYLAFIENFMHPILSIKYPSIYLLGIQAI